MADENVPDFVKTAQAGTAPAQAFEEPNPFDGMSIGQATVKLKANPDLASHFDSKFGDEETVDTMERARLHSVHSYYRGTIAGAAALTAMTYRINNPVEPQKDETQQEKTQTELAAEAAAIRVARGVTKRTPKVPSSEEMQKASEEEYFRVMGDLTKYEAMKPFENTADLMAAIGGGIAGGLPTPEAVVGVGAKGATLLGRMVYGGLQNAAVNVATDPIVQALNIWGSGVQGKYDPVQTALAGPVGFVVGGGLVGGGEVVSKALNRKGMTGLAKDDPSMISPEILPEPEKRATVSEDPAAKTPDEIMPEGAPKAPEVQKFKAPEVHAEGEVLERRAGPMRGEPVPSPDYVRPPEEVKSLQQMVQQLEDSFGIPIRQGRVEGGADVLGHFNTGNGIIHVREYPDFSVSAHEVAHGLETKIGQDLTVLTDRFKTELGPLDYDPQAARTNEGFAEFLRLYMTNPAYAQKEAPGFFSAFNNFMERKSPEHLKSLIDLQNAYRSYIDATPVQAVAATIVKPGKETLGTKLVSKLTDQDIAPTVRNVMSLSYDALINKNQDIYRSTRAIAEAVKERNGGKLVDLLPSDDPRVHFEMLQRSGQSAMVNLMNGVVPYGGLQPNGPSLAGALTHATGGASLTGKWDPKKVDDFDIYLKSRMALVRWDQFKSGDIPNPPFAESRGYFEEVIKQMEKDNPSFLGASDMVNEYNRNKRYRARDAGIYGYTSEIVDQMDKLPFYVPLRRDRSDIKTGTGGTGQGMGGPKAFKGSMRDTISPLNSIIQDTLAMERNIAHNDTITAFRNFSKQAGPQGGKFVEDLPAHEVQKIEFDLQTALRKTLEDNGYGKDSAKIVAEDFIDNHFYGEATTGTAFKMVKRNGRSEPIVFSAEGGVLKASRFVTKEEGFGLYELLTEAPAPARDLSVQMLSAGSSLLTSGVVTHPAYAIRNIFRDQFAAYAFIPGYKPFWDAAKGVRSEIKQDEFARAYAQLGGVSAGAQVAPLSHDIVKGDIDSLAKKGYGIHNLTSLKGLSELVSIAEAGTRLGATRSVFNEKKKMGLSDYDAMLTAVREATDLLDFGRRGSRTETVRAISPFFNSWLQSMDKAVRSGVVPIARKFMQDEAFIKDSEEFNTAIGAWTKLGVTGFGLGAMWAALNWEKDAYRDMGPSGKSANFVVPVGNNKVFLLPKPWELSLGFTAGEYAYAGMIQKDPRAGGDFTSAAWDSLKPNIPIWSNPMIKTTAETVMNYNTFTGGPIVPERLEKVEKEYQVKANTSEIAKKIGRATGQSPVKVDYMISGYLGYWGKDLTTLSNGNENTDPTSNLIDWTLLRAGLKDPAMLSDARTKFWKHMGKTTGDYSQAVSTYNMLNADPKKEAETQGYFNKLANNRKAWVVLNSAANEDGKQAFSADDRRTHPLSRASDAVHTLAGVKAQLQENTLVDDFAKKEISTTPDQRKKIADIVGQMGLAEMVNGLIMTREPGYDKRPLFDMGVMLKQVRDISPNVADEIAARYATKKIYKTSAIKDNYDGMERALIQGGSKADLAAATDMVKSDGYEFGAERLKKTKIRRTVIQGVQP